MAPVSWQYTVHENENRSQGVSREGGGSCDELFIVHFRSANALVYGDAPVGHPRMRHLWGPHGGVARAHGGHSRGAENSHACRASPHREPRAGRRPLAARWHPSHDPRSPPLACPPILVVALSDAPARRYTSPVGFCMPLPRCPAMSLRPWNAPRGVFDSRWVLHGWGRLAGLL